MVDERFYRALGPKSIGELIRIGQIGPGELIRGDEAAMLSGIAALKKAGPKDIAFYDGADPQAIAACQAGLLLVKQAGLVQAGFAGAVWQTAFPRAAFAALCDALFVRREHVPGAAAVPAGVRLEPGVAICAGVILGEGVEIGAGAFIGPNAVIGPGVCIGRGTRVGANAVLQCALIGDHVQIGAGAVLGDMGFGLAQTAAGSVDLPHLGRVIVQDRARIGALSSVDRGQLQDTLIGENAKIDNHCQIAHNVQIGAHAVLAAFAGISGSAIIGEGARLAGRVGIADHVEVGAGASLAAGSGLMHTVPKGAIWGGYPAKPVQRWMREVAWLKKATGQKHVE
jgi:UDP-3-O-[3-hydroxymyristoyl] glucosamine N-acyltransferase